MEYLIVGLIAVILFLLWLLYKLFTYSPPPPGW